MQPSQTVKMHDSPVKPAMIGMFGTILVWIANFFRWYAENLTTINQWLIHLAQIAGLVIAFYSIRILHRNWKTGKNSRNPLDSGRDVG